MTAPGLTLSSAPPRTGIERWRRRSKAIRVLRIALPAAILLILAAMAASVVWNTMHDKPQTVRDSDAPIRLTNPRFVGRDNRGRAFVLTAGSATRDPKEYQRVILDKPALVLDEQGPDPLRITGGAGVYHEDTGKLELSGGVRVSGAQQAFETAESLFDTKTGELVGSGPIQGAGSLGEITAKSYGVYSKGGVVVFKGGVHTTIPAK